VAVVGQLPVLQPLLTAGQVVAKGETNLLQQELQAPPVKGTGVDAHLGQATAGEAAGEVLGELEQTRLTKPALLEQAEMVDSHKFLALQEPLLITLVVVVDAQTAVIHLQQVDWAVVVKVVAIVVHIVPWRGKPTQVVVVAELEIKE
jgi:hypothetical protein